MRSELRTPIHHRHARNEMWSVWLRCPFPQFLALAAYRVFAQLRYARKRGAGWVIREPLWWGAGGSWDAVLFQETIVNSMGAVQGLAEAALRSYGRG